MNRIDITALLVSCFSFGAFGCSPTASLAARSPATAFDSSPAAAPGGASDGTEIVATHVVPKAGVSAVVEGDRIHLRFATTGHPRVELTLDSGSLQTLEAAEAPPFAPPSSTSPAPASAELPDHGHLVAWTEGSVETSFRVRAATLAPDGWSDTPVALSTEGSAIGEPAVAVTPDGTGIVAFIESNADGFQLVVRHVDCATPSAGDAASSARRVANARSVDSGSKVKPYRVAAN